MDMAETIAATGIEAAVSHARVLSSLRVLIFTN